MVCPRLAVFVSCALLISACATHEPQTAPAPIPETRTLENIQLTFDRSRHKIYHVYSNRLKTRPGLKGRVVFRFTVAANGTVVQTGIVDSTLNDREVESGINAVIAALDFGPVRSPEKMTISYPIDFLPN
jgi:TonB family protein